VKAHQEQTIRSRVRRSRLCNEGSRGTDCTKQCLEDQGTQCRLQRNRLYEAVSGGASSTVQVPQDQTNEAVSVGPSCTVQAPEEQTIRNSVWKSEAVSGGAAYTMQAPEEQTIRSNVSRPHRTGPTGSDRPSSVWRSKLYSAGPTGSECHEIFCRPAENGVHMSELTCLSIK
jgi:hypothetical protein